MYKDPLKYIAQLVTDYSRIINPNITKPNLLMREYYILSQVRSKFAYLIVYIQLMFYGNKHNAVYLQCIKIELICVGIKIVSDRILLSLMHCKITVQKLMKNS